MPHWRMGEVGPGGPRPPCQADLAASIQQGIGCNGKFFEISIHITDVIAAKCLAELDRAETADGGFLGAPTAVRAQ